MSRQKTGPLLPPPGLRQHLIHQVPRHQPRQHLIPTRSVKSPHGPSSLPSPRSAIAQKIAGKGQDRKHSGQFPAFSTEARRVALRKSGRTPAARLTKWHCSNYTSAEFAGILGGLGIRQSVGRTGSCFDNALAESFNAAVNVERVHRTVYPTRRKAREDTARYIELCCNRARLHSALGYRTPQEAHDEYLNRQLAA